MQLNNKQIRYLKSLAHSKKSVVTIGINGLSEPVVSEIDSALSHHELIKVKLPAVEKSLKQQLIDTLCKKSKGNAIGLTGCIVILFRQTRANSKINV